MSAYIRCDRCTNPATVCRTDGERLSRRAACSEHGGPRVTRYKKHDPADAVCIRELGHFDDWAKMNRKLCVMPRKRTYVPYSAWGKP